MLVPYTVNFGYKGHLGSEKIDSYERLVGIYGCRRLTSVSGVKTIPFSMFFYNIWYIEIYCFCNKVHCNNRYEKFKNTINNLPIVWKDLNI